MNTISRRRFFQLSALTGGALLAGEAVNQMLGLTPTARFAHAAEPKVQSDLSRA